MENSHWLLDSEMKHHDRPTSFWNFSVGRDEIDYKTCIFSDSIWLLAVQFMKIHNKNKNINIGASEHPQVRVVEMRKHVFSKPLNLKGTHKESFFLSNNILGNERHSSTRPKRDDIKSPSKDGSRSSPGVKQLNENPATMLHLHKDMNEASKQAPTTNKILH